MQFHAAAPPAVARGDASATSARRLESDSLLLPLQPGRLLSVKQQARHLQQLQQHGSPVPVKKQALSNQRSGEAKSAARAVAAKKTTRPEPIDYLKLRRTDESARALQRNRTQGVVVHEILQPSASLPSLSPTKKAMDMALAIAEQQDALLRMDRVLAEMQSRVLLGEDNHGKTKNVWPEKSSALLASQLQQLYRQQAYVQKESEVAAQRVQDLLTVVRNDISLMYKFTPLFKIYARHKTRSVWFHWQQYVAWHRDEQARLALLWPYAVTIQRVFRTKQSRWLRARLRMAIAWQHWQASERIQRAVRDWLSRRELEQQAEIREATKLQAAWRGRRDRRWVKKTLQDQLRMMLRSLTPTGNLHRLHEVTNRNPELARPLNAMLSLVEETTVAVDSNATYRAKNARIAAKHAARPVEATRKQLFHAVFELSDIIARREKAILDAKAAYVVRQEARQKRQQQAEDAAKVRKLHAAYEKIAAEMENATMRAEELLTREYLRMLKTADTDHSLHMKLDQHRREQNENAKMVIEEYQTRYLVSELRRRRQEDGKRLREVEKRQQHLHEQERGQTQQLMALLKMDEMKRNELRTKRLRAKAEEDELWSILSKEQQAEAMRRLELKEQLEEEERTHAEAIAFAQHAHERELQRRREESRRRKQEQLANELAACEAMDNEEKLSRKAHFDMKKMLHAETWRTKREKEQVRYSLDPMHFSRIQALKETEERERRERYLMKREDDTMAQVHEKERKQRYFEACRQRKKLEKAEATRADKERVLMDSEDKTAEAIRAAVRKVEERRSTLGKMAELAEQDELRRKQRVLEARNRKLMYEEELHQRRVQIAVYVFFEAKEKRERELMGQEETVMRAYDARAKKKAEKRLRERCIFHMMKEDVASMERQDIDDEGHRLERLLWRSEDAAAFSHLVTEYPSFLATNVAIVKELCGLNGPLPFDFDYEAVQRHRNEESTLPLDKVPRKKRRPRKFFYHEFFEDDPFLSKLKPLPPPPSKARERWNKVAEHFLGRMWSDDSVRHAYLLMSQHKYAEATAALLEAVRIAEASSSRKAASSLLRQVARYALKHWESSFDHSYLEMSLHFYQKASTSVEALANPRFLQEVATVLEKSGRLREAAVVISGIIGCFPRYPKLTEVIFRGGIVMISLRMYQQSREYLLHTLDAAPFGWEQHEVLLLAARVMQLEGKPRRKLCSVAYEEAFRTNKREAYYRLYPTWQEWIKEAETWRGIGDRYYAKQEIALAQDAYQIMMKRILKATATKPKRQQVLGARRAMAQGESADQQDDSDWLRLARCAAILNDRAAVVTALNRWFARKPYRERVMEQFYAWPLARWKLLGVDVPERVMEVVATKKKEAEGAQAAKLKAIQDQRQSVLRQRSVKARERLIAWPDESEPSAGAPPVMVEKSSPPHPQRVSPIRPDPVSAQPERIGAWVRVVDDDKHETYYWNEETGEVE